MNFNVFMKLVLRTILIQILTQKDNPKMHGTKHQYCFFLGKTNSENKPRVNYGLLILLSDTHSKWSAMICLD